MNKIKLFSIILTYLAFFLFFSCSSNSAVSEQASSEGTIWTCSMHPQIRQDKPGKCPICGMDLIPLDEYESAGEEVVDPAEIQLSEQAVKLAEIQTTIVKKDIPKKKVFLYGQIVVSEEHLSHITARFPGRIEQLFVEYEGLKVNKGQRIAKIYSPELISAQKELIEAAKYKDRSPSVFESIVNKLKLWDITETQINEILNLGKPIEYFDILSPISGTVLKLNVREGDYVREGTVMFEIADLSRLWIEFDAYEQDLPWLDVGESVKFSVEGISEREYEGKIFFIEPFLDDKRRVAKVRAEISNLDVFLKPGMYVEGIVESQLSDKPMILIPKTSVLWTGKRSIVYVKVPNRERPTFVMREIILGPEAGDFYVVEKGLKEGEEIVSYGVFKVDAAAQLAGKPSMMNPVHNLTAPEEFQKQLGKFVETYLKLKDAFVESDEQTIENIAKQALHSLAQIDMSGLDEIQHKSWMSIYKLIKSNLEGIVNMKGIEMKRQHFAIISDNLAKAIESFGVIYPDTLYLEYCPMAFDNKGAYWISDIKQIRNPYFGEKMLTCGEVKKSLNVK